MIPLRRASRNLAYAGAYLSIFLSLSSAYAQVPVPAGKESSARVLTEYMNNPLLQSLFLEEEIENLSHPVDRELREYILNDPTLSKIYEAILKQYMSQALSRFQYSSLVSMAQVTKNVSPQYDLLLGIVADTASNLGFSEKAIENCQIYIRQDGGNLNAFTVSGNQDHIIVVINSALLEKMNISEIRAVLGHEMGHIRAGHPIKGIILDGLYTTLINVSGSSSQAVMGQSQVGLKIAQDILSLPQERRNQILLNFLDWHHSAIERMGVPKDTIVFFDNLKDKVGRGEKMNISTEAFQLQIKIATNAISRAQEATADRFGSAVTKNIYLASAMAKLMGLAVSVGHRDAAIKALVDQAELFYKTVPIDQQSLFNSGSHPASILRTHTIMHFSTTPDIFFANPMMRLMLLEHAVQVKLHEVQNGNGVGESGIDFSVLELQKASQQVNEGIVTLIMRTESHIKAGVRNPRFDNVLQYILFIKESMFAQLILMDTAIQKAQSEGKDAEAKIINQNKNRLQQELDVFSNETLKIIEQSYLTFKSRPGSLNAKIQDIDLRLSQIKTAMINPRSFSDVKELFDLRVKLTALPENRTKGSRVPISGQLSTISTQDLSVGSCSLVFGS